MISLQTFPEARMSVVASLVSLFSITMVFGCGKPEPKTAGEASSRPASSHGLPSDTSGMRARADSIDALYADSVNSERLFVLKSKRLVLLKPREELPDSSDAAVWILLDAHGRPLRHIESPVSLSGDARSSFVHYFDETGQTFLFVSDNSFFAPKECGSVIHDLRREYFDATGRRFAADRTIKDQSGAHRDSVGRCAPPAFRSPRGAVQRSYEALVEIGLAPSLRP